jgi:DNA-binding SARP family transcriptional activator
MLTLTLLGPFRAHLEGRTEGLRLPTQKAAALLAYLALRAEPRVSRNSLAALLWNDVPLSQGRHSLRQELTHIRTALGPDANTYLYADQDSVDLYLERVQVDAHRMANLVTFQTSESMRAACTTYRGELLTGLRTRERAFDAWLEKARGDFRRLAIFAHEYRLNEFANRGETAEALRMARQLMTIHQIHDSPQAHQHLTVYRCGDESVETASQQRVRMAAVGAFVGETPNV